MNRDEDIFSDACALPRAERDAFLDRACAGDAAQRARVAELLACISEGNRLRPTAWVPRGPFPAEEKPGDKIGRYKLLQKIGEGGCGEVWMAEQEEPVRRRVALKVIKLGMDTKEVIARFEAERQALALMDHPNIAKVFDAGATANGRPYFVMELVRGVPITRYCDEANLSTAQRLALFAQVCRAIQHAHEKGIVHRDIKPSNILVALHDDVPVPKVIDFGIAKATQGRLTDATLFTAFEQFIGTPAYMSPEQAEFSGLEVDSRSDVYSLGVLLYELLAGKPPFDPKSLQQAGIDEIRRIIREVEPPRPSTRLSTLAAVDRTALAKLRGALPTQHSTQLSGDLDWIVMHCLEKDRARRYATANELALDLGRHLRHEPVVARPPSTVYRLGKFLRRHRFGFAAAAVVALTFAGGSAVSLWQARRAERAERAAAELKAPTTTLNPKSIAVLPFENLSEDKDASAFFAEGMHEDLISSLFLMRELRCVPRATIVAYRDTKKSIREIAGELGVAYVLSGTVRRAGQKVRLTGTLINARTGEQVLHKVYSQDLTGIFSIQAELAQAIGVELKVAVSPETQKLLARRPTEDRAAYDLLLRSREIRNRGVFRFAPRMSVFVKELKYLESQVTLLEGAVLLDPKFALAWAELAWVHSSAYYGFTTSYKDRSDERRAKAKSAIDRAVQLAPDEPEVRLSLGCYFHYCERDYARAAAEFESVARLQPNAPAAHAALAQLRQCQGLWLEALASHRQAAALDRDHAGDLTLLLMAGRRYEEARTVLRARLQANPTDPYLLGNVARLAFYAAESTREMDEFLDGLPNQGAGFRDRFAQQHEKYLSGLKIPPADATPIPGAAMNDSWAPELHDAVIRFGRGDIAGARLRLKNAPTNLRARLELQPSNTTLLCDLACIEAVLGHPEEALRHAYKAQQLVPMEVDHWQGPHVEENLAFVYAWTGDLDRAIASYARLLQSPHVSPRMAASNVHVMRHSLWFAPLRGDPRWEALLADPKNNAPLF